MKIKELAYIHAEGYSSSSLKHGPFALLYENFPIVIIALDNEYFDKCMNAYEEIKSRKATIILITDRNHSAVKIQNVDNVIKISYNLSFGHLLSVIPLQILAYQLSVKNGYDPDYPKNLAKVVTVD